MAPGASPPVRLRLHQGRGHLRQHHGPSVTVFLDLEKAFELGSTHAILASLVQKGVRGSLLTWIEDYLQRRRARVSFQDHRSTYRELKNGTP